jgi:hypothetical protein
MGETVEVTSLDLRYEGHRLRDDARESRLLASILQRGIEDPLEGVDQGPIHILLNGFKRWRCAKKLGIACVPYVSLGQEEVTGILNLMRASTDKALGILEQARFIVDLLSLHGMSLSEVAETLGRSKAWVSVRRSLWEEMTEPVQEVLFRGAFPVYSYMYTLRAFRRINALTQEELERFVKAVAGKRLSVREIERLARAYFQGPPSMREAIEAGKLTWPLEQMKRVPDDVEGCSEFERVLLGDLQVVVKYVRRVMTKCHDGRLKSLAFYAQAHLLSGGLLSSLDCFQERIKEFHDRCGRA